MQPYKEKLLFWHQVWQSAGSPLNCQLHNVMKNARNVYHYQLRKCKKHENMIKRNKLLDACINGNGDIFSELKKERKTKQIAASSIDGKVDNVEEHFKQTYEVLYNGVDDKDDLLELKTELNNSIFSSNIRDVLKITPELGKQAAGKQKMVNLILLT